MKVRYPDIEDFVYEDYALILSELCGKDIPEARCDVWCEECDENFKNVVVNTYTFKWICPKCKTINI